MEIHLRLSLPRDEVSIPVVRRLCAQAMATLGVEPEVIDDVQLALSEACANVLRHTADGVDYDVAVGFDDQKAWLDVHDRGPGFDASTVATSKEEAESGRGLEIMRAVMDKVSFDSGVDRGTTVHLEKYLRWQKGAAVEKLGG